MHDTCPHPVRAFRVLAMLADVLLGFLQGAALPSALLPKKGQAAYGVCSTGRV